LSENGDRWGPFADKMRYEHSISPPLSLSDVELTATEVYISFNVDGSSRRVQSYPGPAANLSDYDMPARANPIALTPDLSLPATDGGASLAFDRAEATIGAAGASDFDNPSFSRGRLVAPASALAFEAVAVGGASPFLSSWGEFDVDGTGACDCACACA